MIESNPSSVVLHDNGTVYDQDNPTAYTPPRDIILPCTRSTWVDDYVPLMPDALSTPVEADDSEAAELSGEDMIPTTSGDINPEGGKPDKSELTEEQKAAREAYRKRLKRRRRVVNLLALALVSPNLNSLFGRLAEIPGRGCPKPAPPAEKIVDIDDVRTVVANMEFGITKLEYDQLSADIDSSETLAEVESVMQRKFDAFGARFHLSDVPRANIGLVPIPDAVPIFGNKLTKESLSEQKKRSKNLLMVLSRMPHSFLESLNDTDFFYASNPVLSSLKDGHDSAYIPAQGVRKTKAQLVLNSDHSLSTLQFVFAHELNHALQFDQCGIGVAGITFMGGFMPVGDHDEFSDVQPDGFSYTHLYDKPEKRLEQGDKAFEEGAVASPYGSSSPVEDVAETGAALLMGYYDMPLREGDKSISKTQKAKQDIVVARQSLIEPKVGLYYRYIARVGGYFPAETAAQQNPTEECFSTEDGVIAVPGAPGGFVVKDTFEKDGTKHTVYRVGLELPLSQKGENATELLDQVGHEVSAKLQQPIGSEGMTHYTYGEDTTFGKTVLRCAAVEL